MKVLIIEDEYPASKKLERLLHEIDMGVEILAIARSVEEATNWFYRNPDPDLVFMDIQLEDGLCFEIFENVRLETPVIFTTAYDQYALKAFKVNSVDYLLKPINPEELMAALQKYITVRKSGYNNEIEKLISSFQTQKKERFLVKIGERFKSIQVEDINYIFIRERCNFLNIGPGKNYPVDQSLDKIENMLDKTKFFRVNRNFIINFRAIKDIIAYSSNRLKLILKDMPENESILVSRERVAEFKKWMDK